MHEALLSNRSLPASTATLLPIRIVLCNYDICDRHVFICVSEWCALKQIVLWKEPALFWIYLSFVYAVGCYENTLCKIVMWINLMVPAGY